VSQLGKLLDREALDADEGPRARARVTVPAGWADGASLIEIALPRALECARCDGGGCDACGRSGALRGPSSDADRIVRVRLPRGLGEGVAMRLSQPFGRASKITQLWVEVRPGDAATRSVRRLSRARRERRRILPRMVLAMTVLVAILGAALALLTWARQ
jgi:hypothetical protein